MLQRSAHRRLVRFRRFTFLLPLVLIVAIAAPQAATPATAVGSTGTYTNPLNIVSPGIGEGVVESCADPAVIRGQTPGDNNWYMYCTTDPLNDQDRVAGGDFNFRLIPTFKSLDLVNWEYANDAFLRPSDPNAPAQPERIMADWAEPTAGFWAPEPDFFNGKYYLYYGVTDVKDDISKEPGCGFDPAVGVATSDSPTGPWEDLGRPVIYPRRASPGCEFVHFFDSDVIEAQNGSKYIYYGSYRGGIFVSELEDDGFTVVLGTETQVTIANRYEGAEVVYKDGYYYLFVSATDCCRAELTGYSVFVGRSISPSGPFVDRDDVPLLASRVGGTPVLSMNGNQWVGPGHNTVLRDFNGRYWTIYHAVDRFDPVFEGTIDGGTGFTKRPALMDAIQWFGGWPTVRGGRWASDESEPQAKPAAQPGDISQYRPQFQVPDIPGLVYPRLSSEFFGNQLGPQWDWVRGENATYEVDDGVLRFETQAADLYRDNNSASVLTQPAPDGEFVAETKVKLNLPPEGCCHNFVQAGLLIYGDDDNYLKLVHASIWETRQTEWAKEYVSPPRNPDAFYGNTVVGPPNETTWLRIVKRIVTDEEGTEEEYTAYTSRNGVNWVRGGTWTHQLGGRARIGLVSMGGTGFTAEFDYVRVFRLFGSRQ